MTDSRDSKTPAVPGPARFATTRWSVVLSAGRPDPSQAYEALSRLAKTYWYPLYAFVRRQGYSAHDAQDLTQEYLARLLEKNYLAEVDRSKGRFRSFLLASLKHFLANEWDKARALKRGGGHRIVSFDAPTAETRYQQEPADDLSADRIYERRWALTFLDRVLQSLREDYAGQGKAELFEALKGTLTTGRSDAPYADIARDLGMTEGAIKVAVHRLRQRYRDTLHREIADTVAHPSEVDKEIRHLFAALSP